MTDFEARPTQTKVKHEILRRYLEQWTYIIVQGLKGQYERAKANGWPFEARFVYVDCFAYSGRYAPENGNEVFGSPVIGIEAMDALRRYAQENAGFDPFTVSILIERENSTYKALRETLEAKGYGELVIASDNFSALQNGQIAAIRGDTLDYVENLVKFTSQNNYTWSFYFIDPFGPSGIPLKAIAPIVSQTRCDSIIYMPYQDLVKKSGSAAKDSDEHPHRQHLQQYDAMFGTQAWRDIAKQYQAHEISPDTARQRFIDLYLGQLQSQDPALGIKQIPLLFPDRDRIMYYLFLTTHDGSGALVMNEILADAVIAEFDYREEGRVDRTGQLSMFSVIENPGRPKLPEFSVDDVAQTISAMCKGESLEYREVLRRVVNTRYYRDVVRKAMTTLKRQKQVTWEGELRHRTQVDFKQ